MKKRAGAYFGLHFDFHAGTDCINIGQTVTHEMIEEIILKIKPDYIQCDCKGHEGYSSYPTKKGNQAPGFVKDMLKIWREVTRSHGIPLIMHYSGVLDERAIELNNNWAVINEDGTINKKVTSVFKEYAEKLLIPQLIELATEYKVDGVWVDGECWATVMDFSPEIVNDFKNKNGFDNIEKDSNSQSRNEFKEYCRQQFFEYLNYYVDEVHAVAPDFEIASNWAFSSHIPEKVCANVDFLSGDFSPTDSYNSSRFESRCLALQGKPWDLMAWGFYHQWDKQGQPSTTKSSVSLMREAAGVISFGGGFQVYNTQNRDGSIKSWNLNILQPVAEFCRERQPWCEDAKPVASAGIIYSKTDVYRRYSGLFATGGQINIQGAVFGILDGGLSVDILNEYHVLENLDDRKVLILPETTYISKEIDLALRDFVVNGGCLILSGQSCELFREMLGVSLEKITEINKYVDCDGILFGQRGFCYNVQLKNAQILTHAYTNNDYNSEKSIAVTLNHVGKGKVIGIYYNIFSEYRQNINYGSRNLINKIMNTADSKPIVKLIQGPKTVDLQPCEKDEKLLINIINTNGIYSEMRYCTYDEINPIYDLVIDIKSSQPKKVILQPDNLPLNFTYDGEYLRVNIDKIHIHAVIEIT